MRKSIVLILFIALIPSFIFASLVPLYDPFEADDAFTSPGLLLESEGGTPFAVEIGARSAVDYLSYLADPSGKLDQYSGHLYRTLMEGDLEFWAANYDAVRAMFDFDRANFPSQVTDELSLNAMRLYLRDSFEHRFSQAQKASAVLTAANNSSIFASGSAPRLYGDMALTLRLGGGSIYSNGFGWKICSNIGFFGAENLLQNTNNLLYFDVRADVGYAFHLFNDNFTIGASLEVLAAGQNYIGSNALLSARFNADPVQAFTNDFKFGLGFGVTFGSMYRLNENLAFTLDLINMAAFRKYYNLALTDFVDYDGFEEDRNVYYIPSDLRLRALWDFNDWHVAVEFSDVLDQLIWMKVRDGYEFDFFAVSKISFSYDMSSDLSLGAALGKSALSLSMKWKGFSVELMTMLDKLGFGLYAGYAF